MTHRYLIKRITEYRNGDMWFDVWDMFNDLNVTNSEGKILYQDLNSIKNRMNEEYQHYVNEVNIYIKT